MEWGGAEKGEGEVLTSGEVPSLPRSVGTKGKSLGMCKSCAMACMWQAGQNVTYPDDL